MSRHGFVSIVTAALLAASLAGCSGDNKDASWGEGAPATSASAAPSDDTAGTATQANPPRKSDAPSGAWKPCTKDCADLADDTCDGLYAARSNSRGAMLDMMIQDDFQIDEKRLTDCPKYLADWKVAQAGFGEGTLQVGTDVKPGKYVTTADLSGKKVLECFWERRDAAGTLLAGDTVASAAKVTVTIKAGDKTFTSQGCTNWIPSK